MRLFYTIIAGNMSYSLISTIFFVASLFLSPTLCGSVEYYVTPTSPPNADCPQPCYTLDQYALNTTLLSNKENVSLLFLEGLHTLNHDLEISQIKQLRLIQVHSSAQVIVKWNSDIRFKYIIHFEINNLTMYGMTENESDYVWPTTCLDYEGHTALLNHLSIERVVLKLSGDSRLNHCRVNYSRIFITCPRQTPYLRSSLTLYKSQHIDSAIESRRGCKELKLNIINCTINRHQVKKLYHAQGTIVFDIGPVANIEVDIADSWVDCELWFSGKDINNNIRLYIHRSHILNSDPSHSTMRVLLASEVKNTNVQVWITDSKISDSKNYGLELEVDIVFSNTIEICLSNTSISNHKTDGGISVRNYQVINVYNNVKKPSKRETVMIIAVNNCKFISNKVAVVIELKQNINIRFEVLITDSIFYGNENAIDFRRRTFENLASPSTNTRHSFVSLRKVTLEDNSPHLFKSGVIRLIDVDMLNIQDCRFINNQGTAIESYYSAVTLAGGTLFSNNTSTRGGALLLYQSYLYLALSSNTSFFNNYAQEVGGAIYVKQRPYFQLNVIDYPPCFYQTSSLFVSPEMNLNFKSNFASGGGDDIYGGSIFSPCRLFNSHYRFSSSLRIFHFQDKTLSSVTSDPTRVCLCDDQGTPQCANMEYIYRELPPRYPGEIFTLPAVVVGNDFGTVSGIVHSKLLWKNANNITKVLQVQEIRGHRTCGLLNFTIQTQLTNTTYEIQLYVQENTEENSKSSVQSKIKEFIIRTITIATYTYKLNITGLSLWIHPDNHTPLHLYLSPHTGG